MSSMYPEQERLTLDVMLTQARTRIRRLEPRSAHKAAADGTTIIDIRAANDRDCDGVIPGSLHIPRTVLEWRLAPDSPSRSPYAPNPDEAILLLCDHGYSSILAAATLKDLGLADVGDVVGGFVAWREANLPTARPCSHALHPGERVGTRPPEH